MTGCKPWPSLSIRLLTFGFCPFTPVESKNWPCKAKRDFFIRNPTIRGDIVFLLFGMAVGEPPRQDPGALKEQATQLRGLCGSYRRGGLIVSRYAAWSRSWQLLASSLSICWLVMELFSRLSPTGQSMMCV